MKRYISFLTIVFFLFSSCIVSKEQVGTFDSSQKTSVYKKGKEIYLFWDLIQLQSPEKNIEISNYEKIVKRNAFDVVIYYGSLGIFSFYTVKIKTNTNT